MFFVLYVYFIANLSLLVLISDPFIPPSISPAPRYYLSIFRRPASEVHIFRMHVHLTNMRLPAQERHQRRSPPYPLSPAASCIWFNYKLELRSLLHL